jgi:predicted Zn-dependent protease
LRKCGGRRIAGLLLAGAALISCATTNVASLTADEAIYGFTEDERELIGQSDRYERELREEGLVLRDPELQAYVTAVGSKVTPEGLPEDLQIHFRVLREPTMNAFALAQGGIYVNVGLLARLENEAQLAHLLAHEVTHTVNRHQLKYVRNLQNKTVAAKVAGMLLVPAAVFAAGGAGGALIDSLVGLSWASTVTGYGRANEQEADLEALKLVAAAGYAIAEAPHLFELLQEMDDPGALDGFFWSTHPANRKRGRYTRELIESGAIRESQNPIVNREDYLEATRRIPVENVRLRLRAEHYNFALLEAQRLAEQRGASAELLYLSGEAHRLIAEDPKAAAREDAMRHWKKSTPKDVEEYERKAPAERRAARSCYQRALRLDPNFALAHRGLGLLAQAEGNRAEARSELQTYLAQAEQPVGRRYIEHLLEEMEP